MRGLRGRGFVVTGASSGIGRACAVRLLEEGARVVGADLVAGEDPTPAGAPRDGDGRWQSVVADVSDERAVESMIRVAAGFLGAVHGLVNAAGVFGGGPVHSLPRRDWDRVLEVNLTGTFLVAKHVLAHMLDHPPNDDGTRGSLVTIASIEGLEGTAGGSVYNASKGGVVMLTRSMAIDYAAMGIRVNAVCPGFIDTPMTQEVFGLPGMEAPRADIVAEHKLGRMGRPEEIASVAAFLLSDDSSFLTGHALPVDGGYTSGRDHGVTRLLGLS